MKYIDSDISRALENLYLKYNHRKFVDPDPLIFLYDFPQMPDREIVGLIASGLAYGNVRMILKSAREALTRLGAYDRNTGKPAENFSAKLKNYTYYELEKMCSGFKHRFTTGDELAALAYSSSKLQNEYGTLENCILENLKPHQDTIIDSLTSFCLKIGNYPIDSQRTCRQSSLIPGGLCSTPSGKQLSSAAKRINLFMKWMCRSDDVDPGGWEKIGSDRLIMPLDTHIYRFAKSLGFTSRKAQDMRTALEVTRCLKQFTPDDPLKYDFALTRLGIRHELNPKELFDYLLKASES